MSLVDQLSEQAKSTIPLGIEVNEWIDQYNHNFARLIVKECIKAYNDDGYQTEYDQDLKVLQHFGVSDE